MTKWDSLVTRLFPKVIYSNGFIDEVSLISGEGEEGEIRQTPVTVLHFDFYWFYYYVEIISINISLSL